MDNEENESRDSFEITNNSLANLEEHLLNVVPALESAGTKFRVKGETEANKYYISCIDALIQFSDLIDGIAKLHNLDYSKIEVSGEKLSDKIQEIQSILKDMHDAQVNKDWILLADYLEYELPPILNNWIGFIPEFREKIKMQKSSNI